jgi:hypothetical protein
VLHLLALAFIGAVIWVTLHALPLFLVGGMGWDDLRSVLLHRAYRSFTFEGDVIPGVRPSLGTRLVILTLSREDDARRALVMKAMAASERRSKPLSGKVRPLLRMSTRMGQGAEMSRALEQARWFTAPPLGAQYRARSVAGARGRAW